MSSGKPFALNIKVEIKPDRREQFLELIKIVQEQALSTEPGILQFVVGEDVETPNTFHLHEQYTSEEAYLAHTKTPHFAGKRF
jgi:quinol monooxygenase YgiN